MTKSKSNIKILKILGFTILGFLIGLAFSNDFLQKNSKSPIYTNQEFIESLYSSLNTSDPIEVFDYVFLNLDDEVTVFPSENYFYFKFVANGQYYGGTISLSAKNRDSGILGFGYIARKEQACNENVIPVRDGGGKEFNVEDGLIIKKINDFKYKVLYKNKAVIFNLDNPGFAPEVQLKNSEIYLGPSYDEAGIMHDLIFDTEKNHFILILNERKSPKLRFLKISEKIILENRVEFAYYLDSLGRKILIGVDGDNTLTNNWYDGPHDQMPDNYIYTNQTSLATYVKKAQPGIEIIDKYLSYPGKNGGRVAIAPYMIFYNGEELRTRVNYCGNESNPNFIKCITSQSFDAPPNIYYGEYYPTWNENTSKIN